MTTELRDKARAAARLALDAESYPRRMVEAAELQARSIARIADTTESGVPATLGEPSDAQIEASARRLFGATVDSMDRARELARIALTCPPLVACPHWAPGKITFRNACTACAADAV